VEEGKGVQFGGAARDRGIEGGGEGTLTRGPRATIPGGGEI
jgi:hypothetical protein